MIISFPRDTSVPVEKLGGFKGICRVAALRQAWDSLNPKLEIRGCLLAVRGTGPGRGDCDHFVGLPAVEDETTTDEYGRPHGWCQICWQGEQIRRLQSERRELRKRLFYCGVL